MSLGSFRFMILVQAHHDEPCSECATNSVWADARLEPCAQKPGSITCLSTKMKVAYIVLPSTSR